jgi:glucokinase
MTAATAVSGNDDVVVGVDVGGTKCLAIAMRGDVIVDELRSSTPPANGLAALLTEMVTDIESRLDCQVSALGVGAPGLVTPDGVVRASPNLHEARDEPLGPELRAMGHRHVHVENDATAAAFAEWSSGAARGARHMMMITLGTGIGGGFVVDGRIFRGANGFAGEVGHMIVVAGGVQCPCGKQGCWERYASGSALRDLSGGEDGAVVAARASRGESEAVRVMNTFANWVAIGLANLVNAFDPDVIVLGGGVVESAAVFLPSVHVRLKEHLYSSDHRRCPEVFSAVHGERAGAIGAALLGRLQ